MPLKFLFSQKVLENSPWYLAFKLNVSQITLTVCLQLFLLLPSTWLQLNPRLLWEPSMPAQIQHNTHLHLHKHQKTTLKRSTDKKQFVTLVGCPESSFCLRKKKKKKTLSDNYLCPLYAAHLPLLSYGSTPSPQPTMEASTEIYHLV